MCTSWTDYIRGAKEVWMREPRGRHQGNSRQKESTLSWSNLQPWRPLIQTKFFPLAGMLLRDAVIRNVVRFGDLGVKRFAVCIVLGNETLDGEDVLPGFQVSIAEIFAE